MSPKPLTVNPALRDVVYKNRWRDVFDGTVPEGWEPTLKVSVVTAAFNSATLPLTLASLAAQDYPEDLLEVVVVDDGSTVPVEIGDIAPKHTRLIRVREEDGEGWGRSNALRRGIEASDGDIIYWVDSDMILFRDNVREHAKWAHFIPEAATIGHKGFVEEWTFTPEEVFAAVSDGTIGEHHDLDSLHRHWSLDIYDKTDDLNDTSGRNYSTHMGACATVTRAVYDRTHGQDPVLRLGDDTEIAYQIWQAGAVFIPVNSALTYHLGRALIQDKADDVSHYNGPHFAQRMPIPRYRRRAENRQWQVPYITAVVTTDRDTAPLARECVERLLNQTETDLHVYLVGPWSSLQTGRRSALNDPDLELHLTQETFRCEGRVSLVDEAPDDVFPSPYRLDVPVHVGLPSRAVSRMMRSAFGDDLGIVNFFPPEGSDVSEAVRITFTAARSRALPLVGDDVTYVEAMDAVWGVEWKPNLELGFLDLRDVEQGAKIRRADPEQVESLRERVERLRARAVEAEQEVRRLQDELEEAQQHPASSVAEVARQRAGRLARAARNRISS
ncbi:glycosyltransferase family 2 protein [Nocardioides dongxiaopingii]|uniref:glycosyltransferase family 2 protein n=1 Tax=Nocardioides dongxiaopingii TaxID=2576036 RepID=UPI0010C77003|nr:glycosyltransferase family 2 protein [Nocardioides dongxiaopingii]